MEHRSIPAAFHSMASQHPDRIILSSEDQELDYKTISHLSSGMASYIEQTSKAPRVGVMFPSSPAFGLAFLGVQLAQRVPVPLNFLLEPAELITIIQDSGIDCILTTTVFKEKLSALPLNIICLEEIVPTLQAGDHFSESNLATLSPEDTAVVLYTSGTTGVPKGVMLSHENLLSNVEGGLHGMQIKEQDVFLGVLPMFHSFAMLATFLLPLLKGNRVFYSARFVPQKILDRIQDHNVSVVLAVPSMWRLLIRVAQKRGTGPSIRVAISGGEPLPENIRSSYHEVFGGELLEGYGLTETSPVVCINPPDANKPGSAGRVLHNVTVKIVDEDGEDLGLDNNGEIWVQGPNVMQGYFNKPQETAAVLTDDGWFKTGDIGQLSAEGYVQITGRMKDMIISSGENIYPAEIENVLESHPAVFEAAVIGIPDAKRIEVPKAFISLHEPGTISDSDLKTYLKDKIAPFKIPAIIEFRTELPHGPTGKVQKKILVAEENKLGA